MTPLLMLDLLNKIPGFKEHKGKILTAIVILGLLGQIGYMKQQEGNCKAGNGTAINGTQIQSANLIDSSSLSAEVITSTMASSTRASAVDEVMDDAGRFHKAETVG